MFGVVLPIAVMVTLLGLRRLVNVGEPTSSTIHVPSVLLSAVGFGSLVYGLSELGREGASKGAALACASVGLLFVGIFVVVQLRLQ